MNGILIPPIPEAWEHALVEVQEVFPGAVLAGGSLRDLLLERPVNDLDIFVTSFDVLELSDKIYRLPSDWNLAPLQSDLKTYAMNLQDVTMVYRGHIRSDVDSRVSMPIQIIALNIEATLESVCDRCDFGICRIAYDGERLFLHDDFVRDVAQKTFSLQLCRDAESHWLRWQRLRGKYDDFDLNAPQIDNWLQDNPQGAFE